MVLPFLLIGKALKPLAKIKKKAWSAMGGAFGEIRKSVDPMKSFSKILEIVNVLMLPLTYIMTILAMVILKALMPYIGDLILLLDDLEQALRDVGEAAVAAMVSLAAYEPLIISYFTWWDTFHNDLGTLWMDSFGFLYLAIYDFFQDLFELIPGGGGGGGGGPPDNDLPWYIPQPPSIDPIPRVPIIGGASTSVIINLQNSIIDDRDKLIRDIVEQVVIRL